MRCGRPTLALLLAAGLAAQESRPQDRTRPEDPVLAQVDRLAAAELAKSGVGGCTVGVVLGDKLVWARSYGVADIENDVKASNAHVYRIGSITKQFTGLMLLQLVERGEVRLSDPVAKYFPEIKKVGGRREGALPITLQQLATMTSGLDREPKNLRTYLQGPVADWEKVLTSALAETGFRFEPGTRYHYSNIGYAILGATSARAAKTSFVDHVRANIFRPLGMTHTDFEPNETIRKHIAKGYTVRRGRPNGRAPEQQHKGRGYKVPNGAMYTTVADLAKFLSFQLGQGPETVLKKRSLRANFARAFSNGNLSSGYGVGFMVRRQGDLVTIGHGGSVAGYNAAAWVHRPTQSGVIVLRNVSGGRFRSGRLCQQALALLARSRR